LSVPFAISNNFNYSFSSGQTYLARTIYHMMRLAQAIPKEQPHYSGISTIDVY